MKTTSLLLLSAVLVSWLSHNPSHALNRNAEEVIQISLCDVSPPPIGRFYLMTYRCGEFFYTACCCADGNGKTCPLEGMAFYCIAGGPFDCTSDLSGCEESYYDCYTCCHPCMT